MNPEMNTDLGVRWEFSRGGAEARSWAATCKQGTALQGESKRGLGVDGSHGRLAGASRMLWVLCREHSRDGLVCRYMVLCGIMDDTLQYVILKGDSGMKKGVFINWRGDWHLMPAVQVELFLKR